MQDTPSSTMGAAGGRSGAAPGAPAPTEAVPMHGTNGAAGYGPSQCCLCCRLDTAGTWCCFSSSSRPWCPPSSEFGLVVKGGTAGVHGRVYDRGGNGARGGGHGRGTEAARRVMSCTGLCGCCLLMVLFRSAFGNLPLLAASPQVRLHHVCGWRIKQAGTSGLVPAP